MMAKPLVGVTVMKMSAEGTVLTTTKAGESPLESVPHSLMGLELQTINYYIM